MKKVLLFICIWSFGTSFLFSTFPSQAQAGVFPEIENSTVSAISTSDLSFSHTGTGTDLLAVVLVSHRYDAFGGIVSVTYGGQTMNLVPASGQGLAYVYYLANAPSGAQTVSIDVLSAATSANRPVIANALTITGANMENPVDSSARYDSASDNTIDSTIITTKDNVLVLDVLGASTGTNPSPSGEGHVSIQDGTYDLGIYGFGYEQAVTAGAYTLGWTTTNQVNDVGIALIGISPNASEEEKEYPLYTQIESAFPSLEETREWADDSLAGGAAGRGCETIAKCGCTITSLVMLGRAHGITTGIDGSDVNPGNLNRWLTENGGYTAHGLLQFDQAVKYFGKLENGVEKTYLKWTPGFLSADEVKDRVADGEPIISSMVARNRNGYEIPTHFILVTELLEDGSYGVNDPLWYNTRNLDDDVTRESYVQDYNDRITNGRNLTFVENPVAVANALSASVVGRSGISPATFARTTALFLDNNETGTAPVEMYLVTPGGERLGVNPKTGEVYELSNGHYWRETFITDPLAEDYVLPTDVVKSLAASQLENGVYRVYVIGTGTGSYELSGFVHDASGEGHMFEFSAETVPGMISVYGLNLETGEVILLPVDRDTLKDIIDGEIADGIQNMFFKMWAEKIFAEVEAGKTEQALQHLDTFRTLMKAREIDSAALMLTIQRLETDLR